MTATVPLADRFQALADPTRLRIVGLLQAGEVCVCHIHESLRIPQPKASRHLAYLRAAGLVDARREGQWMHYRLSDSRDPVIDVIREAVTHALGHVDAVKKDAKRLEQRTGCCVPARGAMAGCACCEPSAATS